ncbi:MAG: COX15/CtaA family protein [Opitutaceae bacterium]
MPALPNSARTRAHKPALAIFAAVGGAWVFVLVALGAFTTTIGAGMAFADWPLSNGSVNPKGWLQDIAMFAEHSHRLSGTLMGIITITLAVWLQRTEARPWLRKLGWWSLAIVIIQGIIGGQRVTLDAWHVAGFEMSIGQMLRIPHGILAQIYVCMLIAIAVSLSHRWIEGRTAPVSQGLRQLGFICCSLMLVQLIIAVTMRHNYAGLAIPTFPASNPDGSWWPAIWNFHVAIQFAHRVMAAVLAIVLVWFALKIWTERGTSLAMRCGASVLVGLLGFQIMLGAHIIWSHRAVAVTTGHVLVGACTLATTFWLVWLAHRDLMEQKPSA